MTHCKNLLFDLGGVIMDIDRERCVRSFRRLGFEKAAEFLGDYGQQGPFGDIEAGRIDADAFHEIVSGLIPGGADDGRIDRAFNAFLVGIPVERLRALRELRRRYGIYLLSNTNEIMWRDRIDRAFRAEGLDITAYFDGIVTSFEAKSLKPSPEIFRYAAEHLGINPEETTFLDDSEANVAAARALGFGGLHVAPGREFTDILKENGL